MFFNGDDAAVARDHGSLTDTGNGNDAHKRIGLAAAALLCPYRRAMILPQ
jgi:hypothetical protein